jgi:hypothetical protein
MARLSKEALVAVRTGYFDGRLPASPRSVRLASLVEDFPWFDVDDAHVLKFSAQQLVALQENPWLKAPDGTATKLTERQWLHVRTPSFKAWFGDWEKFAGKEGGVWNDQLDEVSKAVGRNGEPLVVYHGTDKGGFSEFSRQGGIKRGDLGIFTTDDRNVARTYVHMGRAKDIQAGDIEEGGEDRGPAPGIYALFLNIRNPQESDFEGANWNGSRAGQFMVVNDDGEQIYTDDGRGYFSDRDDAFALVMQKGGTIEEAQDHYESTDMVTREARKYGNDGAIIRQVVDDGGGPSGYADASDVFVAFEPNQVKSADFNDGTYSVDEDDIRRSAERDYKLELERRERARAKAAALTPDETGAITMDAEAFGLGKAATQKLLRDARDVKKAYPAADGWARLEAVGVEFKKDDEGKPIAGTQRVRWQPIPYAFNIPPGRSRAPAKLDKDWAKKVADKFDQLIDEIYERANSGDRNAQTIVAHQTWYRNVAAVLRREYGGFGDLLADLLGATSPNMPVDTNWRFSIDILRRFVRGDFDAQMERFVAYLDRGGDASKYPAADKIRQISGKLYGMNSTNAMKALADMWRVIETGQAPKARNFALNLIGQSKMATIDVWAARMLRRSANMVRGVSLPRIPPPAEQGVSGVWNADGTRVNGQFGFGAAVMDDVAKRQQEKGRDIEPPDLQAIAWFAEKELWGTNRWTTVTGEGGSFEENIEAMPVDRYVAGWSIQQGERVPDKGRVSAAQARVLAMLNGDDSVIAARVLPTKGLYGNAIEESFDTEWTATRGKHDPSMALAEIARLSKENEQYDIFVSRVLGDNEESANARPGVEIYFKRKADLQKAMPVLQAFTSRGQDGFTMVVDPRARPQGASSDEFIGVRLQYVPEISMRWDEGLRKRLLEPGGIDTELKAKEELLADIARQVRTMDGVAFAAMQRYDTLVVGQENYDEYIGRVAEGADLATGSEAWFGRPIRQGLERAAARLAGDGGQDGAGGVPDAGGELQRSTARDGGGGNEGRSLAPLAGAPSVVGAAGPDPRLVEVAERYARSNGIFLRRQAEYVKVDPDRATRIAEAYAAMPHAPRDTKVREAYDDLIRQTRAQYDALAEAGYEFTFFDATSDPYKGNPWNAMRDLRANKRMAVYGTYAGYGTDGITQGAVDDNPMLADTGLRWKDQSGVERQVVANDLFRAVHDAFGHGLEGAGFRADGEENAWQAHVRLFTGPAVGAITSETRGQNSWLNYGPYGEKNRNAKVEDTVFADQKTGLMPEWTWQEGRAADEVPVAPPQDLLEIFRDMDGSPKARKAAKAAAEAHPLSARIQEIETGFFDILEELEDSKALSINCD